MKAVYTRWCFWADACTINSDVVLIHPRFIGDLPLVAHEMTHATQMLEMGAVIFWFKYLTRKSFRQAVEVEAYKAQIEAGASAITCARHLATDYWLDIDQRRALVLLTD